MENSPLISLIVPTKNSSKFLEACLMSIANQTYTNIELIVVDNFSSDKTTDIAKQYTTKVFQKGPERCAQRNFGVVQSEGEYILFIDSDMELSTKVVERCVLAMQQPNIKGVIIPEESFGVGLWAQCKKLERSFYVGVDAIEAARFFKKTDFHEIGGYNEALISGEDWDLSDRMETLGPLARINEYIFHNEGNINLRKTLAKKYYYAKSAPAYLTTSGSIPTAKKRKMGIVGRYILFFKKPVLLFKNPVIGLSMIFMKTAEFFFGFLGIVKAHLTKK